MTRVSVCVPTYEPRADHLDALLRSVLAQQRVDLEVVVRDDASAAPAADALPRDPRVRTFRNGVRLGMVGNWNAAVRSSVGDLVMVVGQDDMLAAGALAAHVREFEDPQVVVCSSGRTFVDGDGRPRRPLLLANDRSRLFVRAKKYVLGATELAYLCLRNGNPYGEVSALMFRRSAFDAVAGFDPAFAHAADVDFALRVAERGRAVYVNEPLLVRRRHGGNLTRTNFANGDVTRDRLRLFERHRARLGSRGERDVRTALTARALYDVARAPANASVRTAAWESLRRLGMPSPSAFAGIVREIATGRNADER